MKVWIIPAMLALTGCASSLGTLNKDILTGSCTTITTGSLTVTTASGQLLARPADTITFCPPAVIPNAPAAPASAASGV